MAKRLPDGSIQMRDGRVLYGDYIPSLADMPELTALLAPVPSGLGFISGGGGRRGPAGPRGPEGPAGPAGPSGSGTESQTDAMIVSASVDSQGLPNFMTNPAGLTARLAGGTTEFVANVEGTEVRVSSDVDLALSDDSHNFIFIDQSGLLTREDLPTVYAFEEPAGPAAGQTWFDLSKNRMKRFDGASFVEVSKIPIAYARTDSGSVTSQIYSFPIGLSPHDVFSLFGDGSDGFLDVSSGTTTLAPGVRRHTAIVVRGTGILDYNDSVRTSPQLFSQGVVAAIGSNGIRCQSNSSFATQNGGVGGAGGGGGGGSSAGGGFGGDRRDPHTFDGSGGGSPGGTGAPGSNGAASLFTPDARFAQAFGGAGGGDGGDGNSATSRGSAGLTVWAPLVAIGASADITCDGDDGNAGGAGQGGAGGAGGGVLQVIARAFVNAGSFTAAGGTGGAGGSGGGDGGDGGAGVAEWVEI